jgi:Prealbumin-like fold domain
VTQAVYQPPPPIVSAPLAPLRSFTSEEGRGGELWSPPTSVAAGAPLTSAVSGQLRVAGAGGRDFVLGGVSLRVFGDDGGLLRTLQTAPDGSFEAGGFARGWYRIEADRLELASRGARLEAVRFDVGASASALNLVARPLADSALAMLQTAPSLHQTISAQASSRPVQQTPRPAVSAVRGSVSGRMVLARDARMAGLAGVELQILDRGGAVVKVVTTGADGSFQAAGLAPGQYFVVADRASAEAMSVRVDPIAPINLDGDGAHDLGVIVARRV